MATPVNLSFEIATSPGQPQGWTFTHVATGRQRANYAAKPGTSSPYLTSATGSSWLLTNPPWLFWGDGFTSSFTIQAQFLFAEGAESGDFYVMWIDEDNHLRWDQSGGEFMLTVGGTEMASGVSVSWSSGDVLSFAIENNEATTSLTVTGGGGGSSSESAMGAFTISELVYLFGDSSGSTESFTLQDVSWYVPPSGFDGFEWYTYKTSFDGTPALYGTGVLTVARSFDGFEATDDGWDSAYATSIVGGTSATFDLGTPSTTEDFETEWAEVSGTATNAGSTATWSDTAHGLIDDMRVRVDGTLPAPFSDTTLYFVVNATSDTFELSTTSGGSGVVASVSGSVVWYRSHTAFITSIPSPTTADFHPGGGTDETFEAGSGEGWDTSYETSLSSSTGALYGGSAGPASQLFEDFEEVSFSQAFTVLPSTNEVVATGHGLTNGEFVSFVSTGSLPAGLQEGIIYIVATATTNRFTVTLESGGTTVAITDTGTGTHQLMEDQSVRWTESYD